MGGFTLPLRGFLLLLLLAVLWVADRGRPIFAAATPQSSGGAGVRARRAQRKLKQSAEAVKASELGKELVDAVVEESGKPASEILPPGGEKALVTGLAVAEGIHVTQGPSDVVRVFGASLMRRLMALTGSWKLQELPDLDRVLITRTPPLGDERQGRSSACVSVTGFDASEKPAPIIFVNGLEFVQMLFMVMATMHQTSSLTATKDLLAFLPLLSTWRMVAQLQMLYYTFIAVPLDVALRMLEEEVLPSLHGDAKGEAEAKLTELRKISHSVRELAPPDVAPKDFTIQLDTSDSTEKAIVKACVKNDIPLVRYGTSSLFLKRALQNRSSFFQSLHKGGSEAEDIVGHLVQSAVTHYLDTHQRSLSVSEFMKPEFWENEDEAAVTLDQVLEMTNKAVQEAFLSVQERLEGHASSQELVHQLTSEYMTSEEAVKKLSTEFTGGITRAQKAIGEFYEKNDARGLCELLQNADTKEHPWISQLIYMYSELSKFCKKGQSFCQELLDCLQERPPKLTAAMETFEMIRLLQSILGSTTQGGAEALARSLSSELKAEAQKIEDIESAKEEEASRESRHAEQLSTSTSSEASSSEVKGAEGTSLKEGSADSVDSNAGSSGSIAASGISDETAGTPVLSEEARTFLADASNFRATLRMTDLGLVRASLQALRYYAMYRQLSTGALARLSSDCYFLEEQGAAQQELREASKFLPDLASHAVEASAKDAEASTSQSSSHHAFVERALAIQAPSVLGAAALRSGFALRDAWTSPSALSLVQASEALGTKRSKNGRGRKKKRSRKRKPKQKTKHLETSGAPPLQTVLRRHRAVSCFVLAAEAAHLLTQHPFFELKTSERAKTIFERTHQQMQSSWDNTLYAETADQRHLSSAIHSYGLAPLSLQTFLHTRETILSWLKKESTFLFEKCGDPAKHTLLPASHASDSLGHFSFSLQDLNGLQRLLMEVCAHIAVRKDLPFMTTPLSLTEKIMRIPGDPAAVTAGGSAVVPLVTEMLQVIGNNDFGSTFDPLWNRVLAAGEVLRDSEHKSDELTKALEKVEKKRSKDLANINKSLRISTPVTQIKASFDRLGLRMWLASLTVAHTGLGSQKGKNRKVKLLTSRMQFAKGRLHVLECLEKHEALTEVAFLKASSPRHKPSSFKACPKPSPMPDQQALERIYDECLKADTSPAEKPKKKKGKFASHGKEVQKGGLGSDAESAAAGSETEASASSAASEPSEALSGSLHAASERHTVFSLGGDNSATAKSIMVGVSRTTSLLMRLTRNQRLIMGHLANPMKAQAATAKSIMVGVSRTTSLLMRLTRNQRLIMGHLANPMKAQAATAKSIMVGVSRATSLLMRLTRNQRLIMGHLANPMKAQAATAKSIMVGVSRATSLLMRLTRNQRLTMGHLANPMKAQAATAKSIMVGVSRTTFLLMRLTRNQRLTMGHLANPMKAHAATAKSIMRVTRLTGSIRVGRLRAASPQVRRVKIRRLLRADPRRSGPNLKVACYI
ncbi:putative Trichohyalin [Neospora caninum Liverpool]|uniref:Putative Trichohyalin n=1 Tax=Neospora caninum (strain Liverpool) TaxID=572307 RepID=F0VM41_NEOCL|nr:putative Trichohyalin [Neospora caninum Liverpool]CBZ54319.1 putative Trichohyalin [Neospora caninum Liverpool]|eukprot:XP_003884350.1 putative Trichohyalin [Neospora caninum Liverpool]